MEKAFGTLVRQLRLQKGYSLRELARRIGLSPNFLSKMELGHFPPPGEKKIVLIAETLEQHTDELLALAGKVSSDLIEIILQRPKETAALLRRLRHAPARKIAAANDRLALSEPLEFYPLETVSRENHTAVVGETGSGKSLLTKYLIKSYFQDAKVRVYDSAAATWEWGELNVAGRSGDYAAIAQGMAEDIAELRRRTALHGEGQAFGGGSRPGDRGIPEHGGGAGGNARAVAA